MLDLAHQVCAVLLLCPFFALFILHLPFSPHVTIKCFLLDSPIVILCRNKQRNMEREKKERGELFWFYRNSKVKIKCSVPHAYSTFTNTSCLCKCKITALKIKYNPFAKAFLDAKERWVEKFQGNLMIFANMKFIIILEGTN